MLENKFNIENKIIFDEPMKKHTSFGIGGKADFFLEVETKEEMEDAIRFAKYKKIPFYIIGNGSNVLVTDKGIRGLVIKNNISNIEILKQKNNIKIIVGAGYKIMALGVKLAHNNISGFEELSGIPGTIGGAVFMNAGAYGKEMKDVVVSTTCMDYDGKILRLKNVEQDFKYRSSIFSKKNYIILEVELSLAEGNEQEILDKMNNYLDKRKEKQPLEYRSAGSTFKRKDGVIVSQLIDECGLKGLKIGGAKVSEKHAGFIINYDNATADDILKLIKEVKDKVFEKYNIQIEEEIKVLGEM